MMRVEVAVMEGGGRREGTGAKSDYPRRAFSSLLTSPLLPARGGLGGGALTWEGWLTLGIIVAMLVLLARDVFPPAMTVFGATVFLLVVGITEPRQAFAGFSNPAPIAVAALYVLARAVEKTGALQPIVRATLGDGKSHRESCAPPFPNGRGVGPSGGLPSTVMVGPRALVGTGRT